MLCQRCCLATWVTGEEEVCLQTRGCGESPKRMKRDCIVIGASGHELDRNASLCSTDKSLLGIVEPQGDRPIEMDNRRVRRSLGESHMPSLAVSAIDSHRDVDEALSSA